MTIYDELGLTPDATDEQIRQAHRQLVKLLHPDLQQDPELRRIAELQLMRINRMVEQLLQSSRPVIAGSELARIAGATAPPAISISAVHRAWQKRERAWKQIALLSCGVAAVALLAFALPDPPIRSQQQAAAPLSISTKTANSNNDYPAPSVTRTQRVTMPDSNRRSAPPDTGSENHAVEASSTDDERPPSVAGSAGFEPPSMPVATGEDLASPPANAPKLSLPPPKQDLNGVWLYAGDPGPGAPSKLYPPEYIELRLSQEPDGTLAGEYRGRYTVTDLAISPSVAFRFREKNPNLSALPWNGTKGSSGTVSLQLLRTDVLQVVWKTTTSATQADGGTQLGFGAATLIRRH
jgi:hypothetical protein